MRYVEDTRKHAPDNAATAAKIWRPEKSVPDCRDRMLPMIGKPVRQLKQIMRKKVAQKQGTKALYLTDITN